MIAKLNFPNKASLQRMVYEKDVDNRKKTYGTDFFMTFSFIYSSTHDDFHAYANGRAS